MAALCITRSYSDMQEGGIGRVLVASLHQGIADILPTRLGFYENWLNAEGLREGTIGLAPLYAVLSFLRQEGDAYQIITTRAGEYAAEWTVSSMPALQRRHRRHRPFGGVFARARRDDLVRVTFLPEEAEHGVQRRQSDGAFAQPFSVQPVLIKPQAGWENVGDALMEAGDEDATDAGFAHVSVRSEE